jgi:hypothetical protein
MRLKASREGRNLPNARSLGCCDPGRELTAIHGPDHLIKDSRELSCTCDRLRCRHQFISELAFVVVQVLILTNQYPLATSWRWCCDALRRLGSRTRVLLPAAETRAVAPPFNTTAKRDDGSLIPLSLHFAPQLGRISTTLTPAASQVVNIGVQARSRPSRCPLREAFRAEEFPNRLDIESDFASDGTF